MINILSYAGLNLQVEVCIWTVLGILRTIFDATLFKVNSNLKQVWQMNMPVELALHLQRFLRVMISGVMLVQCFTLYVYLASYIVLLYPVFLEERPTLVLPWLLLAAVRSLLCELVSLALGLATCVMLGPARSPCVKFVVTKLATITPSAYMWMLVYSYYHTLKLVAACKAVTLSLPATTLDNDMWLELAVRRRRTKSLLCEKELRKNITAHLYEDESEMLKKRMSYSINEPRTFDATNADVKDELDVFLPLSITSDKLVLDTNLNDDWFSIDVFTPRDTDRILEQFVIMLLKIGIYIGKGFNNDSMQQFHISDNSKSRLFEDKVDNNSSHSEEIEASPEVGSFKGTIASYLREYPQIFMKNPSENKFPGENMKILLDNNYNNYSKRSAAKLKSISFNKALREHKREGSGSKCDCECFKDNIKNRERQIPLFISDNIINLKKQKTIHDDSESSNKNKSR